METRELMNLRAAVLLRHRARPFRSIAVVGPDLDHPLVEGPTPGGRLRFLLRSTLPGIPEVDLTRTDQLLALEAPDGPRLVILVGPDHRLSYALQSQLVLEAIHPTQTGRSGLLDAFATTLAVSRHAAAPAATRTK
jgi:hypothetical protein